METTEPIIKQVYWYELEGSKFNKNISPQMIFDSVIDYRSGRLKNDSKKSPKRILKVIYDREYVVQYIAKKVIYPLSNFTFTEILALLKDSHRFYLDKQNASGKSCQENIF